ncbi:putative membrane protein [Clostridioides difficile CD149]|uniref:hypothetical protein n=1 Tax=Clostridioides difficile TaxID=1496 RepID=UPI00038D860F|nr:hypothetical protein [Clostridioides difficile]OFU25023.1 hypothetical protein HMPREF3076_15665 [Clostridium sp. HMSC19B12]EGT3654844.1 hypothetical protein [Clostridioides difficile]EGT3696324.1 hypothetical protein [Clostridioides difficile]EGT3964048.1 hypothetical protein [Clostridioides difficile]EGT4227984.1 hypothetical protein [Clostridioides difficile]
MKHKYGYLLLESVVSLSSMVIIILVLYSIFLSTINLKLKVEDKIELQQQSLEIIKSMEGIISNSMGIMNVSNYEETFKKTTSIKCRYVDENNNEEGISNKEIILNERRNKLFVNSLNGKSSQAGGYEIGDYVDEMYVSTTNNGQYVNIKLKLSKRSQKYETDFKIKVWNFSESI